MAPASGRRVLRVSGIRRRAASIVLVLAILASVGAYEIARMPSSIFPTVTFPLIRIIATASDQPAAQMMPAVTRPLEEAVLRVPGIQVVRTTTSRGSSELTAEFAWNTDLPTALTLVLKELERVRPLLPAGTSTDTEWMNTAIFPIMGYALTSDTKTQAELRDLAEYTLLPELVRIPGVSQVQIQGGRTREFEVLLDHDALLGRGLSAADVVKAVRDNHQVVSAGLVESNHELYLALVDGLANSREELSRIAITVPNGVPAQLGELGTVRTADEVSYIRTTANGKPAVLVNIVRQPSASTLAIASGVDQLLRTRPELIPRGVEWTMFYDQASFVSGALTGTRDAVLIGVGLAFVVLVVFLRNVRFALVAILSVPVVAAVVGLGLAITGQTLDLMTLAGFAAAIGLIVDDAIVVVENVHRHAEQGEADPVASGLAEIAPAMIGSSLSTIVIMIPFALLGGVVGAFFKPLALTMALALVVSFFVSIAVVPIVIGRGHTHEGARTRRLRAFWRKHGGTSLYARAVRGAIGLRLATVLVAIAMLAAAWFVHGRLGTDFMPHMDEGSIILDYWSPPGTSLTDTDAMLVEAEKIIMATPDVASYSRRTGTQLGFAITEPNRGDYVIQLRPAGQRRPIDAVIEDLRQKIGATLPALHIDFGQLLEDNIGDLTGGKAQPIEIKVFGDDQARIQRRAKQIAQIIAKVDGVTDVFDGIVIAGPALELRVHRDELARAQLTTADLHAALEPAISGTVVGQVRVGEKLYDLRIFDRGVRDLGRLLVRTPSGAQLPVSKLATISTGAPETEIDRENLRSYVGITARLAGRDLGGAIADIRARIGEQLPRDPTISIVYGGIYEQQQQSFTQLLLVLLAGLALVAVVVLVEFADWRAPLVTAIVSLGSLTGVFTLLLLTGMTLNISSFVAAIMMVGITGENAIFVIHEAQLELRRGVNVRDAWLSASRRRARPVAMTVLATGLALMPLGFAIGQGSQLIQPLAIGVIGGFTISSILVLFLLPGLYALLDPHGRLGSRARPRPDPEARAAVFTRT